MSGKSSARRAEPPDVATPTGIDPRPKLGGYAFLDLIVAGSAILISCVSLFIATQQSRTMEKTLAASNWPLLQIHTGNSDDSGNAVLNFEIQNVGVGPAIVKTFSVEYGGKRTSIPGQIIELCCGTIPATPRKFERGDPLTNFIEKTVIRAGGNVDILQLARVPKNDAVWQRLNQARFKMKFHACYCSILGDCWESDLTGIDPKEVKQCAPVKGNTQR